MNFEVKNAPGVVTIFEKGVFSKLFIEKEIIFVNDNLQDNFLKRRRRRRNKKYKLVMKRYKKNK